MSRDNEDQQLSGDNEIPTAVQKLKEARNNRASAVQK